MKIEFSVEPLAPSASKSATRLYVRKYDDAEYLELEAAVDDKLLLVSISPRADLYCVCGRMQRNPSPAQLRVARTLYADLKAKWRTLGTSQTAEWIAKCPALRRDGRSVSRREGLAWIERLPGLA